VADRYDLRVPALRIDQGGRHIFVFGVDGKRLHEFTTVSRVRRSSGSDLQGYQRPEVQSHIKAIRQYLESPGAMLPNAIVLAFNSSVRFEAAAPQGLDYITTGELIIPVDETVHERDKPAWLVDGQQRSAAIRDADISEFPVAAVGFIADGQAEQRSQFILVNSTKPLPKGLIHELLPETIGHLPPKYARRQVPAYLMSRLNIDADSPFRGLIATPTAPDGFIKDNSVLKMLENSLYEGALYQYRDPLDGSCDAEEALLHLKIFWALVRSTFEAAWLLPPRKSRLTHGVGIQAMGFAMDALTEGSRAADLPGLGLGEVLRHLAPHCAWTAGDWAFSDDDRRRWNGLQNTPNDVRLLTNHIVRLVKPKRRSGRRREG
jgi:DGQHR domain-containing protein